jgi:hypothetical protein
MAIFGFLNKTRTTRNTVYTLTTVGRDKVQHMECEGKTLAFLDYLDGAGASTLSEIAEQTRLKPDDAEILARKLVRSRYIEPVTT